VEQFFSFLAEESFLSYEIFIFLVTSVEFWFTRPNIKKFRGENLARLFKDNQRGILDHKKSHELIIIMRKV